MTEGYCFYCKSVNAALLFATCNLDELYYLIVIQGGKRGLKSLLVLGFITLNQLQYFKFSSCLNMFFFLLLCLSIAVANHVQFVQNQGCFHITKIL